jgi:hypothetical protein
MTVRRASGRSNFSMIFSQSDCLIFLRLKRRRDARGTLFENSRTQRVF